jgi:hypothetical protein
MLRAFHMRNWTDQEQLEYRKWMRRVAFCYGLAACLLLSVIAINQSMNMAATGATDRTAAGINSPTG